MLEFIIIVIAIIAGEAVLASEGAKTGVLALIGAKMHTYTHRLIEILHYGSTALATGELFLVMFELLFDLAGDIGTYVLPHLSWIELIVSGFGIVAGIALVLATGSGYLVIRAIAYSIIIGI